jgi:hypothetical protein
VFVLELWEGPKAEVHEVEYEELQQCEFRILARLMKAVFLELLGLFVLVGQLFQFLLVDFDVCCLVGDPGTSVPDELTTIWQHKRKAL